MLDYINLIIHAIISGNYLWIIVIYFCIIVFIVKTQWKILYLPRYRLKFIIFSTLSITALTLWATGLLKWPGSGIILIMLIGLVAIFIYSSSGSLLWPCSSILRDVSNHIKANEPERADEILRRYKRFFLDPTEKYSYYCKQAVIASIKSNCPQSIKQLDRIDVDTLNLDEITQLGLLRAHYFTQSGDHKKALQIIERLSNPSEKHLIQISLIRAVAAECEGNLTKSSDILLNAITYSSDKPKDAYYKQVLNNIGRIRRMEMNYTESLNYYRKALELAKVFKEKSSMHIAYQNLIHSLVLLDKQTEVRDLIPEYQSMVDLGNPNDLIEYYNFLAEYYRQINNKNKLSETIDEGRERIYPLISRKEQIIFDISQLRMRWNAGVLSPGFLYQIENQYHEYADLSAVEKICCYMEIHHVLQRLKEQGSYTFSQEDLFDQNRETIHHLLPELENHLNRIPEYCVFEKCRIMWDIVRAKRCSVDNYNSGEVLRMLEEIKKTHLKHGNFIEAFNIGLDICDEALSQKNYIKLWEFLQSAMDELQQIHGHPAEIPAFIRIACYAYNAGEHELAKDYLTQFEQTGVQSSHYADWIQHYYNGLKQELNSSI